MPFRIEKREKVINFKILYHYVEFLEVTLRYSLLLMSIWGLFLVFEALRVIRKQKEVIIINSRGIMLYRVKGKNDKSQSGLFVDWEGVIDIRFWELSHGLDLAIYNKRKGCIQMDISEYFSIFQGREKYKQFKKDVFHYYNSANKNWQ